MAVGEMAVLLKELGPVALQAFSAIAPYIGQVVNKGLGSGSSTNAQSQNQQTTSNMSGGESSSQTSMQMGNTGGIASLWNNALTTPTGSNWKAAFQASQGSAQTANNLQSGQWAFAQATDMYSNMLSNLGNLWSQTSARSYNRKQAEAQRDWNRMMRQTAYQDTVKDLKAAGLNPILAASNGATASGSGATASTSPGNFSSMTSAAVPSAHAASAQSMYDYGNNTMQFISSAMENINSAKQYGYTDFSKQMYQMASNILEASTESTQEYSTETKNIAEQHLKQVLDDKANFKPEIYKRGGRSSGGGAGRGR